MPDPIFYKQNKKNISMCCLLNILPIVDFIRIPSKSCVPAIFVVVKPEFKLFFVKGNFSTLNQFYLPRFKLFTYVFRYSLIVYGLSWSPMDQAEHLCIKLFTYGFSCSSMVYNLSRTLMV